MKKLFKRLLCTTLIIAMIFSNININVISAAKSSDDGEFEMYYTSAEKVVKYKANKTTTVKVKVRNGDRDLVSYTSSDESVATVDRTGKVTFKKEGATTITALYEPTGDMESILVKAYNSNSEVKVNATALNEAEEEDEEERGKKFTVKVGDEFSVQGYVPSWDSNSKIINKSSNKRICSIDKETGSVKAMKKGRARIKVYVQTEDDNEIQIGQVQVKVEGEGDLNPEKTTSSTKTKKEASSKEEVDKIKSIRFAKGDNGKVKNYVKDYPLSVGVPYGFKIFDNNGNEINKADLKFEIVSGDKDAFEVNDDVEIRALKGGKEAKLQVSLKKKPSIKASVRIGSVQEIEKIEFVKKVYNINDTSGYKFNPIITLKGGEVLDPQKDGVENSDKYQYLLDNLVLTEVDGDGNEKERTDELVKITKGGKEVVAKKSGRCYLGYVSTTNPDVKAQTELQISLLGEQSDMVKSLFNTINKKREELGLNKLKWKDNIENITKEWLNLFKDSYDKTGSFEAARATMRSENGNDVSMLLEMDGINHSLFYETTMCDYNNYNQIEAEIIKKFEDKDQMFMSENLENINIVIIEENSKLNIGMIGYSVSKNGKKMDIIRYINKSEAKYFDAFKERKQPANREVGEYVEISYKYSNGMVKILDKNATRRLKGKYGFYDSEYISEYNPRVDRSNATEINDTRWANKDGVELRTYPSNQDEYKYNAVIETVDKGTALKIVEKYPDSWCLVDYEGSYLYVFADNLNAKKM